MTDGKGRRTRRHQESRVEQQVRGNFLREWLQDRSAQVQKQNAAAQRRRPSGTGVTAQMKAISHEAAQREPVLMVKHEGPNRESRRRLLRTGRPMPAVNSPYVNLERDSKPDRRLRVELRNEAQS